MIVMKGMFAPRRGAIYLLVERLFKRDADQQGSGMGSLIWKIAG
jgi:hypothetical protein